MQALASIWWKLLSCIAFAGVNCTIRYLTGGSKGSLEVVLPIYVVIFWQNLVAAGLLLPFLNRAVGFGQRRFALWHVVRILGAIGGMGLWYWALFYLPVAQVVALSFSGPLLTLLGAVLTLRERLTWTRAFLIGVSVFGGFLIARPDQSLLSSEVWRWAALLPVAAAAMFATVKLVTRHVASQGESPASLTLNLLVFSAIGSLGFAIPEWRWPILTEVPWLIILGALSSLAHYAFNRAYALAQVTYLMPVGLFKFILTILLGYLCFNELPRTWEAWLGMALLLTSVGFYHWQVLAKHRRLVSVDLANDS